MGVERDARTRRRAKAAERAARPPLCRKMKQYQEALNQGCAQQVYRSRKRRATKLLDERVVQAQVSARQASGRGEKRGPMNRVEGELATAASTRGRGHRNTQLFSPPFHFPVRNYCRA